MISGAVGPGDHEHETTSIYQVSILGGAPRKLRGGAFRAELSPDDSLVAYMDMDGGIKLADADGENPRDFIVPGEWEYLGSPKWSSDGKRVVYRRVAAYEATIESRGVDQDSSTVLLHQSSYLADAGLAFAADFLMLGDRLVYAMDEPAPRSRDQNLWEITVDPDTGDPRGEPRRLTDWAGFRFWTFSTTADGSQLAFLNNHSQTDVRVGQLSDGGRRLDDPRRLTLDDRDDSPLCWTPGGAVVFESNRYGSQDLLVQRPGQRNAQDLVIGEGDQSEAQLTPDGNSLLYWESQAGTAGPEVPRRLLRIPIGGGPTEFVAEVPGIARFDCATSPQGGCLLFEFDLARNVAVVSRLDPVAGKGEELWRLDLEPNTNPKLALSPDGSRLAMVGHTEAPSVRLLDALTGDVERDVEATGLPGVSFADVAWLADGSGFYLSGESPRGLLLLRVGLDGKSNVLGEDETGIFSLPRPSPDGRYLAFGKLTLDANAWLIEQF